jgi:hypothetical protein
MSCSVCIAQESIWEGGVMEEQELQLGQSLWWLWQPYCQGYAGPVIAVFVMRRKTAKKSVGIAVLKADRKTWEPKWVSMEYVRIRK